MDQLAAAALTSTRRLRPSQASRASALAAVLAAGLATLAGPRLAAACTPWAENLLAWSFDQDLVVVGMWSERSRLPPPRGVAPDVLELRRLSTGEPLVGHDCRNQPTPAKCTYDVVLASAIPPRTTWRTKGTPPPRTLTIKHSESKTLREISLDARAGRGKSRRLLWLQVMNANEQERRRYEWNRFDVAGDEALMAFSVPGRGGNCPNSTLRVLRVPLADIADPGRPGRQATLLGRPARFDERFEHWRTVADLGPIPPNRLVEAMEAAEREEQFAFGAQWYRETTRGMPAEQLKPLAAAVKANQGLYFIRPLLGL